MRLPPAAGRALPPDTGPLPAAHTDVTTHLSDVAGPPAPPRRPYGVPMAGPTTRTVGGNQPPQAGVVPSPKPTPGGMQDQPPVRGGRKPPPGGPRPPAVGR